MYLFNTITDPKEIVSQATARKPFGPGLKEADAMKAAKLEVWATTVSESCEKTEFRLLSENGKRIATGTIAGY